MTNPLDPTGLQFTDRVKSGRSIAMTVSGFRDRQHAEAWGDAFYMQNWGYHPILTLDETDKGITIHVEMMTSSD